MNYVCSFLNFANFSLNQVGQMIYILNT